MFRFRFDAGSGVPPYLQLVQQVEQAVRLGELRVGDRLPTVKDLARTLVINPNTVLKAYRELEHRGLAKGRPGRGTFVERESNGLAESEQAELRAGLETWLATARDAGMDAEDIAALVAAVLHDFKEEHR
ncbi:GntR family transcriptional regulator [Prauserella cavernicola]|uniref:GntR family transcriptional regulator n=1 Tax=Prauserella cavernicola TaxID=2800127 RepID=A0A934QS24_9PSEU|nr:GntR family transcriptional regulator [Prauserella cavernicola]MBK1785252.1 GntR family transcriptional regulator [Prauserella cavernicola]